MLSPGMHCRPSPSGRAAAPGSEAKFGRPSSGPSDAPGDLLAPLLFRKRGNGDWKKREEKECVVCVLVCSFCVGLNVWVCVCVFLLRGRSERNATVPLHMFNPLRQPQGLLKTDTHPWQTHTHTQMQTQRGCGMEGSIKLHRQNTYQDRGAKLPIRVPLFHSKKKLLESQFD